MTISKKQVAEEKQLSYYHGLRDGVEKRKQEVQDIRQLGIIEISRAVADLATANAKLTYALSRITDKLL